MLVLVLMLLLLPLSLMLLGVLDKLANIQLVRMLLIPYTNL